MKRLVVLPVLVALAALCTAASPPPKPTSVIAGLAQQVGNDGRYYSVLAPYSIRSFWHGTTFSDANGQRDRFRSGDRYIDVLSFVNSQKLNTSALNRAAESALQQNGFSPKVSKVLTVLKEHVIVLVFSDSSGSYAESVFNTGGRGWVFALISDKGHVGGDLTTFANLIRSFRLEHGAS